MTNARTSAKTAFYVIFMCCLGVDSHAAAITNLDSKPHDIEVGGQQVTIAANETWRTPGKVKITYNSKNIRLEDSDEYAIWNDHDLVPQRRVGAATDNND